MLRKRCAAPYAGRVDALTLDGAPLDGAMPPLDVATDAPDTGIVARSTSLGAGGNDPPA